MNNPQLTVVMPVHNRGDYVKVAVDSVLHQTFSDYELIIVDDNSSEEYTCQLLSEYEQNQRIRIIHNEKKSGAAISRNTGLKNANGKYIIFLDSDDFFSPNMFEVMVNALNSGDYDLCECNILNLATLEPYYERNLSIKKNDESYYSEMSPVPFIRMIRKSFLDKHSIKFQDLSCSNDVYFSIIVEVLAENIIFVPDYLVHYRVSGTESITSNRCSINIYYAFQAVENKLKELNLWNDYIRKQMVASLMNHTMYELIMCSDKKINKELWSKLKNDIGDNPYCYFDSKNIINQRLFLKNESFQIFYVKALWKQYIARHLKKHISQAKYEKLKKTYYLLKNKKFIS